MEVDRDEKTTPEELKARDNENRAREQREQAGMRIIFYEPFYISLVLALPYSWTQELEELDITVPVPQGTRGSDLIVVLRKRKLSLALKGPDREPILEGELCKEIKVEDSTWTIRKHTPVSSFKY